MHQRPGARAPGGTMSHVSSYGEIDLTNRVVAALTGADTFSQGSPLEPEKKKMKSVENSQAILEPSQVNASD